MLACAASIVLRFCMHMSNVCVFTCIDKLANMHTPACGKQVVMPSQYKHLSPLKTATLSVAGKVTWLLLQKCVSRVSSNVSP